MMPPMTRIVKLSSSAISSTDSENLAAGLYAARILIVPTRPKTAPQTETVRLKKLRQPMPKVPAQPKKAKSAPKKAKSSPKKAADTAKKPAKTKKAAPAKKTTKKAK